MYVCMYICVRVYIYIHLLYRLFVLSCGPFNTPLFSVCLDVIYVSCHSFE